MGGGAAGALWRQQQWSPPVAAIFDFTKNKKSD